LACGKRPSARLLFHIAIMFLLSGGRDGFDGEWNVCIREDSR
jgi:hypothetical protein